MNRPSPPSFLVLHAVRLLGLSDSAAIAERARINHDRTGEILHDAQQRGWVQ
jgi:hypothetical protein